MKGRLLSLRALISRRLSGRLSAAGRLPGRLARGVSVAGRLAGRLLGRLPGRRLAGRLSGRLALGVFVAVLVFVAALVSGSVDQTNLALSEMGFDPDRAQLIAALLVGAMVAGASILAGNRSDVSTLLGCLGSAALFVPTFARETQSAMATTGVAGAFDGAGWLITVLALVVSGLVSGWAGAALATVARPTLADAIGTVGSLMGRHRVEGRAARRLAWVAAVALVLVVTVPVFGDIVNYTPDSHMLHGRPDLVALGAPDLTPPPTRAATPSPTAGGTPSTMPSTMPSTTPSPTEGPSPTPYNPRPWLPWRPDGGGTIGGALLPGPWKSSTPTAYINIYTPPGYSAKGSRRYPVLYEAPYAYSHWDDAANVTSALDTLISKGLMPPFIVVAMSTEGGAYTDSECADSYDGREWFDKYVAETVVPWIDAHYLTIAQPTARAILGASQGGYCAAALAVHHPDVFGTSLVFSGYFHAGRLGPPSTLPFGTNQAFIDAASPDVVIFDMPIGVRTSMYFIIVAQLSQNTYGEEAVRFDGLLNEAGVPHLVFDSTVPHGWAQLRVEFARALYAWADRMISLGVFEG